MSFIVINLYSETRIPTTRSNVSQIGVRGIWNNFIASLNICACAAFVGAQNYDLIPAARVYVQVWIRTSYLQSCELLNISWAFYEEWLLDYPPDHKCHQFITLNRQMLNNIFIPELFLDFRCTALDVGKDLDIHSISCPCMVFRCKGIVLTCITI